MGGDSALSAACYEALDFPTLVVALCRAPARCSLMQTPNRDQLQSADRRQTGPTGRFVGPYPAHRGRLIWCCPPFPKKFFDLGELVAVVVGPRLGAATFAGPFAQTGSFATQIRRGSRRLERERPRGIAGHLTPHRKASPGREDTNQPTAVAPQNADLLHSK